MSAPSTVTHYCSVCGGLVAATTAETDVERRLRHAREDFAAAQNIYKAAVNTDSGSYPGDVRRFAKDALECAMRVSEALQAVRAEQEASRSKGGRWHG